MCEIRDKKITSSKTNADELRSINEGMSSVTNSEIEQLIESDERKWIGTEIFVQ